MHQLLEGLAPAANLITIGVAFLVIAVVALLFRWWTSRNSSLERFIIPNPPKDTVILHQYGKALTVPSISPFVMKLETYLRVAKIRYINNYSRKPGPKGKLPWIQYNDKVVPDSQFCIEFLNVQQKIDLNKKLTAHEAAIGHLARRTAEDSLYWTLLMWRLVYEETGELYKKLGVPSVFVWYMRRAALPSLRAEGIGRHSLTEVTKIMEDDLHAISQILGSKNFLFGDGVNDVTEFDCALFGQLSQLVWQMPGTPVQDIIAEKFPNLIGYCERMKTAFWPDWDERLLEPPRKPRAKHAAETAAGNTADSRTVPGVQ